MPIIQGKRVRLRAVDRDDLPKFVEWINDPEVTAGLMMYLPMSMTDEEHWFESLAARPPDERPLGIEIGDGDDRRIIGNSGFHNISWRNRSAEVGIMIGEKALWNQGYGTEAMRLLLRHGFNTLNLNRVYLRVYASNPRAVRSYEKAGYVHEGRERQGEYRNGKYIDVLHMSVLRDEWKDED